MMPARRPALGLVFRCSREHGCVGTAVAAGVSAHAALGDTRQPAQLASFQQQLPFDARRDGLRYDHPMSMPPLQQDAHLDAVASALAAAEREGRGLQRASGQSALSEGQRSSAEQRASAERRLSAEQRASAERRLSAEQRPPAEQRLPAEEQAPAEQQPAAEQ